jgi:D-2-hydroxyacid dehydrogenase (NADP+)
VSRLIFLTRGLGAAPENLERARAIAPELELFCQPPEEDLARRVGEIEIACSGLPAPLVPRALSLRWVQLSAAGAEDAIARYRDPRVLITNASGVHAVPMAEHVLALLLCFARRVHHWVRAQLRHEWAADRDAGIFELRGKSMLVVGVGAVGAEVARLASGLGMRVVGVRRSPAGAAVEGVERLVGPAALETELPEADIVVLTVPLTRLTRGMFGERELGLMKAGSYLVNVGRGKTVVEAALVRALREGRIAGAGLDVFEEEPLGAPSPLWGMENVIITPHSAGSTPRYAERLWEIFLDNLGRYVRGEQLRNIVSREAGY